MEKAGGEAESSDGAATWRVVVGYSGIQTRIGYVKGGWSNMQRVKGQPSEAFFINSTLKLGKLHWHLVKADIEMSERSFRHVPVSQGGIPVYHVERTEFGNKVGKDVIHWWVHKRENAIDDLHEKTALALEHAQVLKDAAYTLLLYRGTTYDDLLRTLANFAESYVCHIDELLRYTTWLHDKDVLAPCLLYSYRVWGTTRIADRRMELESDTLDDASPETIRRLTEIVFGLFQRDFYTFELAYRQARYEAYDSLELEDVGAELYVPVDRVLPDTIHSVIIAYATYFELIRNSLRNLLLEIEQYKQNAPSIGRLVLGQPVPAEETRHCEFKDVSKSKRPANSIKNTADEYVVAFLNSDGGSIYWGIGDSNRDVIGVHLNVNDRDEVRRLVSEKLSKITPSLDPTEYQIEFHQVHSEDGTPISDLFVVEVNTPKGDPRSAYFTGGNEVFVRGDGVKRKLVGQQLFEWIKRRLSQ